MGVLGHFLLPAISFSQPLYLVLLAALPGLWWLARRRSFGAAPGGWAGWPLWRQLALWLRLGSASLLVLALAGLKVPAPARSVATVFVVDQSESVPADVRVAARNWVRQALAAMGPDDLAGIVTFGREAHVEQPLSKERDHAHWDDLPPGSGLATNIGAALELAADLLPPPGSGPLRRLVLLSDGNENLGDARRALLRPQLRDVEVGVLALPPRLNDTAITSFSVPPAVRDGEPVDLRLTIWSPSAQAGTLRIWANDHLLTERTVALQQGSNEVVTTAADLAQGFWTFHATIDVANDSRPENNESWAFTVAGPPARVLLVTPAAGTTEALRATLATAKIEAEELRPAQVPDQPDQLAAYDAVILDDVPATALTGAQMEALRRFVGDRGHGLVVLGGEHSFGLGAYAGSPLEAALPVTARPPQREQVSTLALVLVIDRSGSMSMTDTLDHRAMRIDLAKEGAIQAVETLLPGDQVGIIAFDSTAQWISPLHTVQSPADLREVASRIATIQPEGGTEFLPPLQLAYQALRQARAQIKHVIFLTDGEASEFGLPPLLAAMRQAGITVSTVGVSGDISGSGRAVLERMARAGGGRSYFTNTPDDIPQLLTQEARLAGQGYKQERDFVPRLVTAAPTVRMLVPAALPPLHGYVRVTPRPAAEVVLSSDTGEPILAQWQYGLGRALVWTSDAQGPWARDWVGTEPFQRLWPQALRWTMPAPADPTLQVTVQRHGEQAVIRVDAMDAGGAFRDLLLTSVDIAFPDGTSRAMPLPQIAPGQYAGTFRLTGPGVYALRITQRDGTGLVATALTGYALPYLPEYAFTPPNRVLLERLAAETGGPLLNRPQEAWRRDTAHAWQPQEVWDWLLMLALVLFVGDVACRRLRPSADDWAWMKRRVVGPARQLVAGSGRRRWLPLGIGTAALPARQRRP